MQTSSEIKEDLGKQLCDYLCKLKPEDFKVTDIKIPVSKVYYKVDITGKGIIFIAHDYKSEYWLSIKSLCNDRISITDERIKIFYNLVTAKYESYKEEEKISYLEKYFIPLVKKFIS